MGDYLKELDFGFPWSYFKLRVSAVTVSYNVLAFWCAIGEDSLLCEMSFLWN